MTTPSGSGDIAGAMSFALLAAEFVSQAETWPVFSAWLENQPGEPPLRMAREHAAYLTSVLAEGMLASQMIAEVLGDAP